MKPTNLLKRFVNMSSNNALHNVALGNTVLPPLGYRPNQLEPYISGEIMTLHHDLHHAAYVNALNKAEVTFRTASEKGDLATMLSQIPLIKFNGGGHYNHSIFWTNLAPVSMGGGGVPKGPLINAINRDFGSFDKFRKKLTEASTAVQGSGWGWLVCNPDNKTLEIKTTSNQDPVTKAVPLLGIDVWEHAYYLQYKNKRADYVQNIWNVINWNNVSERYEKSL